jgi:cell division protein FtsB
VCSRRRSSSTCAYILIGIGILAEFIRQLAAAYAELQQMEKQAKAKG